MGRVTVRLTPSDDLGGIFSGRERGAEVRLLHWITPSDTVVLDVDDAVVSLNQSFLVGLVGRNAVEVRGRPEHVNDVAHYQRLQAVLYSL